MAAYVREMEEWTNARLDEMDERPEETDALYVEPDPRATQLLDDLFSARELLNRPDLTPEELLGMRGQRRGRGNKAKVFQRLDPRVWAALDVDRINRIWADAYSDEGRKYRKGMQPTAEWIAARRWADDPEDAAAVADLERWIQDHRDGGLSARPELKIYRR